MLKFHFNEKFKEIEIDKALQLRYAISNLGRLISFTDKFENGRILKGSMIEGYRIFRYKVRQENKIAHKHFFFYKLVAKHFIPKDSDEQVFVLHLDHDKANDYVGNLKWATKQEQIAHSKTSPAVIEAKKNLLVHNIRSKGRKLNAAKVMFIKKQLLDPNRKTRLKMIAKQFGVSEMQLQRIKTGENWGHIKV